MAQGNFGNPKQHAEAGRQSSGNTGNPKQHAAAGKKGGKAQTADAKSRGNQTGRRTAA